MDQIAPIAGAGKSMTKIEKSLSEMGYIPRRAEILALSSLSLQKEGAKALLIEGPAGAGKTFLAEVWAKVINAPIVVYQCHSWSDAEELFVGVDVASAVAGHSETVRQDGVLAVAARRSHEGDVVLLIDEIDKAPERTEYLLLDFLQSGRVPIAPAKHIVANVRRLWVFITSNAVRPLHDATLRRVRRLEMTPLSFDAQVNLLVSRTGAPRGVCTVAWKAALDVAHAEGNDALSVQEGARLVDEVFNVAESTADIVLSLQGWAARHPEGRAYAPKCPHIPALWGEIKKSR